MMVGSEIPRGSWKVIGGEGIREDFISYYSHDLSWHVFPRVCASYCGRLLRTATDGPYGLLSQRTNMTSYVYNDFFS